MAVASVVLSAMRSANAKVHATGNDGTKRKYLEEKAKVRDRKNPENYTGLAKSYILFSRKVEHVTESGAFNAFIIVVILIAGILVGVQTYGCSQETKETAKYMCYTEIHDNRTIEAIDTVILIVFILEAILKMTAEALEPWRYFTGPEAAWNNFDFAIIVLCLPIIPTGSDSTVAVLRLFRLMRVMKLVGKIPQLQMIVMGLVSGMKSIGYIGMLLGMVFYLYAIIGISFFGENDPWHFQNLVGAFNTLFRMMTLEDWTDVMYINLYGCDATNLDIRFDSGFYTTFNVSYLPIANNVSIFNCVADSQPNEIVTVVYFFSFIVVSALVALSLVLGAITIGMADSMAEMKRLDKEKEMLAKMEEAKKKKMKMLKRQSTITKNSNCSYHPDDVSRADSVSSISGSFSNISFDTSSNTEDEKMTFCNRLEHLFRVDDGGSQEALMQTIIRAAWDGEKVSVKKLESHFLFRRASGGWYSAMSRHATIVRDNSYFQNLITVVILSAGVVVGIEADTGKEQSAANAVILIVFIVEIIVKVIAEYDRPLRFFYHDGKLDKWNVFDFVVVAGSLVPMGSASSIVTMLRLLRLLRVLKLVRALPELQVIVEALMNGVKSIYYIGIIMFLFFYVFGILGMILFRDNDPWHFGTLHDTLLTLFRSTTLEDWTDVMYVNMLGCMNYGYEDFPDLCDPELSADPNDAVRRFFVQLYFWVVVSYGGLMLVPLFIGVIVSSMEEAVQAQKEEKALEGQIDDIVRCGNIPKETIVLYCKVFEMIDVDEGGSVDADEIILGLGMVGIEINVRRLNRIMRDVLRDDGDDFDSTDGLTKPQFVRFMDAMRRRNTDEKEGPDASTTKASEKDNNSVVAAADDAFGAANGKLSPVRKASADGRWMAPGAMPRNNSIDDTSTKIQTYGP
eukprot:g2002.t1